jgi:hypothetical protein
VVRSKPIYSLPTIYILVAENVMTSSLAPDVTSPLNFAASKWIWNSATATTNTVVGLRKNFMAPALNPLVNITTQSAFENLFASVGDRMYAGIPLAYPCFNGQGNGTVCSNVQVTH